MKAAWTKVRKRVRVSTRLLTLVAVGVLMILVAAGGSVYAATGGRGNSTQGTVAEAAAKAAMKVQLRQAAHATHVEDQQDRAQAQPQARRQVAAERGAAATREAVAAITTSSAPVCAASDLAVTYMTAETGMLSYFAVYAITNHGSHACSLSGFPTVEAFHPDAADGTANTPLKIAVRHSTVPPEGDVPSAITIQPSSAAGVIVAFSSDGTCGADSANATTIALTLPGTSQAFGKLRFDANVCQVTGENTVRVSSILAKPAPVPLS
jgi:hypothetical protein